MKCLYPKCGKSVYARGLCLAHYKVARNLVLNKKTTWKFLVKEGKALEARYRDKNTENAWFIESIAPASSRSETERH